MTQDKLSDLTAFVAKGGTEFAFRKDLTGSLFITTLQEHDEGKVFDTWEIPLGDIHELWGRIIEVEKREVNQPPERPVSLADAASALHKKFMGYSSIHAIGSGKNTINVMMKFDKHTDAAKYADRINLPHMYEEYNVIIKAIGRKGFSLL